MLAQKQPAGNYAITQYGKLVLHLSSPLEFALKHKEYFSTHAIWRLPERFMNRIGELSQTELVMGMMESTARSNKMIYEAQQFMWGISPEPLPQPPSVISEQIPKGVEYKMLSPQPPERLPNLENRTFSEPPAILALTEKEAGVSFFFTGGRVDYAGFYGKDPFFLNWARDLFLHYWDKGRRT